MRFLQSFSESFELRSHLFVLSFEVIHVPEHTVIQIQQPSRKFGFDNTHRHACHLTLQASAVHHHGSYREPG